MKYSTVVGPVKGFVGFSLSGLAWIGQLALSLSILGYGGMSRRPGATCVRKDTGYIVGVFFSFKNSFYFFLL